MTVRTILTPFTFEFKAGVRSGVAIELQPVSNNDATANATLVNDTLASSDSDGVNLLRLAPVPWNIEAGAVSYDGSGLELDLKGCRITGFGSGPIIRMYDSSDFETRTVHGGGITGSPKIDGASCTGESCAVHIGDIFGAKTELEVWNFNTGTDSKGVWYDNQYAIAESSRNIVTTYNCKTGIVHDLNSGATATGAHVNATGSYERSWMDYQVNQVDPSYNLVEFRNGAFIDDGKILGIHGNAGRSSSALTSAAVRLVGSSPAGILEVSASVIQNTPLSWGVECDGDPGADPFAPMTVYFDADENAVVNCTGQVNFGAVEGSLFTPSNSNGQWAGFIGRIDGDPNLPVEIGTGTTNAADGTQAISATAATAVTSLSLPVAPFKAYAIDLYLPHTGAGTTGTFTFSLSVPGGISTGNSSLDVMMWSGTTLTAATRNSTSATLDSRAPIATVRLLRVKGTIVCQSGGTLSVTGAKTSGGSNVTIAAGAYLKLDPLQAP